MIYLVMLAVLLHLKAPFLMWLIFVVCAIGDWVREK